MIYVVNERLSPGFAGGLRGRDSHGSVSVGKLLFDCFRKRFGEDCAQAERPETAPCAAAGDLLREIAVFASDRVGK